MYIVDTYKDFVFIFYGWEEKAQCSLLFHLYFFFIIISGPDSLIVFAHADEIILFLSLAYFYALQFDTLNCRVLCRSFVFTFLGFSCQTNKPFKSNISHFYWFHLFWIVFFFCFFVFLFSMITKRQEYYIWWKCINRTIINIENIWEFCCCSNTGAAECYSLCFFLWKKNMKLIVEIKQANNDKFSLSVYVIFHISTNRILIYYRIKKIQIWCKLNI